MEKSKKEFEDKSDAEEKVIFHVFEGDHSAETVHRSEWDMIHVYVLNFIVVAPVGPNSKGSCC